MSRERDEARMDLPPRDKRERAAKNLRKAYPMEESSCFAQLLRDIDKSYRKRPQVKK